MSRRARVLRVLRFLLLGLVALYVVFLVAMNGFLATTWPSRGVASATNDIALGYDSAYSFWPGRVTAKGLWLRFHDKNVEALLTFDEVSATIALAELRDQSFHATSARGYGSRFYMRHKVDAVTPDTEALIARYPRIPGFDPIPIFAELPPGPPDAPKGSFWRIHIENAHAELDELWMLAHHYVGKGYADGAFRLMPTERVWVDASWTIDSGELRAEPDRTLHGMEGSIGVKVEDFDVQKPVGLEPLRFVTVKAKLYADVDSLDVMDLYLAPDRAPLRGKDGRLGVDAVFREGTFDEKSSVALELADATIGGGEVTLRGPLKLVGEAKKRGLLEGGGDAPKLALAFAKAKGAKLSVENASVRVAASLPDVAGPVSFAGASAKGGVRFDDLALLDGVAGSNVGKSGRGLVTASLQVGGDGRGKGSVDGNFRDVVIEGGGMTVEGAGAIKGALAVELASKTFTLSDAKLEIPTFTVKAPGMPAGTTWVRAHATRLDVVGAPPKRIDYTGDLEAGSCTPVASLMKREGAVAGFASKWLDAPSLNTRVRVQVAPGTMSIDVPRGRCGYVEMAGGLTRAKERTDGAFLVRTSGVSAGVTLADGSPSISPFVGDGWLQKRRPTVM